MERKPIATIKTKGEAQWVAIDYQSWQSNQSLSYKELARWTAYFMVLAKKFHLVREFKENGII